MNTSSKSYKEIKALKLDKTIGAMVMVAMTKIKRGIRSQIAQECNLREDQVWRRLSELESQGKIRKSGRVFRSASTQRLQDEWEIIEQCECDAPIIRTGGETGEYCSICQKDIK